LGSIDMSKLQSMADPQMVTTAQKHPDFYKVKLLRNCLEIGV
jgi:hypothetical protein